MKIFFGLIIFFVSYASFSGGDTKRPRATSSGQFYPSAKTFSHAKCWATTIDKYSAYTGETRYVGYLFASDKLGHEAIGVTAVHSTKRQALYHASALLGHAIKNGICRR